MSLNLRGLTPKQVGQAASKVAISDDELAALNSTFEFLEELFDGFNTQEDGRSLGNRFWLITRWLREERDRYLNYLEARKRR